MHNKTGHSYIGLVPFYIGMHTSIRLMLLWKILTLQSARKCSCMPNLYDFSLSFLKKAENVSMDLCSLWLWVWQCHHGFCRLHRLSLPFVMPEIYHEQFEQKMGTPTRHYHHYTDESIIKSGRPMSSALISQPFSLTLPYCTGDTSFIKSNLDDNAGKHLPNLGMGQHWTEIDNLLFTFN